ncbi:MAG: ethylbenzene dehydrogenase-related protein [Aeoliella sp.]
MPSNDNTRLMVLFVGGMCAVVVAMMVVLFVATRRPVVMLLPQQGDSPAAAQAPPVSLGTATPGAAGGAAEPMPEAPIVRVTQAPNTEDPLDAAWNQVTAIEIPLQKQQSSEPMLDEATIDRILVQAARDDERLVWRLSWKQETPVFRSDVGEFSDAVAIQFPMKEGAPYTMGGPDMPVTMLYWKALWQKDIDEGFQDVTDMYPNSWYDFYWFAAGTGPQPAASAFENESAQQYMIGRSSGNPMSTIGRKQPVEELTAHGFGSSTHVEESPSTARGVWKDGAWYVVIDRPVDSSDPLISRFEQNLEQQMIAIAVWDGGAQNRGARKHITNWIPMRIDK